jgi:hypothetical protein
MFLVCPKYYTGSPLYSHIERGARIFPFLLRTLKNPAEACNNIYFH